MALDISDRSRVLPVGSTFVGADGRTYVVADRENLTREGIPAYYPSAGALSFIPTSHSNLYPGANADLYGGVPASHACSNGGLFRVLVNVTVESPTATLGLR